MRAAHIHTEAIGQLIITGTTLVSVLMKYIGKVMSAPSQPVNLHRWERRVSMMCQSHPIWRTASFMGGEQMKHQDAFFMAVRPLLHASIWCHQKHLPKTCSTRHLDNLNTKWWITISMGLMMIIRSIWFFLHPGDVVSQWNQLLFKDRECSRCLGCPHDGEMPWVEGIKMSGCRLNPIQNHHYLPAGATTSKEPIAFKHIWWNPLSHNATHMAPTMGEELPFIIINDNIFYSCFYNELTPVQ